MRLILLTSITMIAFAANSLLNRMAVESGAIDTFSFAVIRVLSGAIMLCLIVTVQRRGLPVMVPRRLMGAFSLVAYMVGFSLAYATLEAGLGALILFGTVQVAMFGWSAWRGERPLPRHIMGAGIAFGGLMLVLWPREGVSADIIGALLMVGAGLGWAAYTLAGKGARDPLSETAANFVVALPILLVFLVGAGLVVSPIGAGLAILSGAVTSGLGYALWYHILPQLKGQTAAVVQLSVPIIAILAGALLLDEAITRDTVLAATLVLGGIALSVSSPTPQADRK
ncbi:DMT family transporter [Tateyamaria sp.]|jgi:drug/metabolite transporter (DMT)-like permease|nr:DMT family transporter [Tateyamaria sp.]MDG2055856.1 DMT family transporter [Tateyamaria sp.]